MTGRTGSDLGSGARPRDLARSGSRVALRLSDYAGLVRLECLPMLSAPFLLGAAVSPDGLSASALLWFGAGAALHGLSCASNDIADREFDARDPKRAGRPLTSGRLPLPHAVTLSVALGLVFALAVLTVSSARPWLLWCVLLVTVWGNIRQKRSSLPSPVFDLLWGASVAAPLVAFTPQPSAGLLSTAAALALVVSAFDVAGGDVKDLAVDLRAGLRTSGIALGLRDSPAGVTTSAAFGAAMAGGYAVVAALVVTALLTGSGNLPLLSCASAALLAGAVPLVRWTIGPVLAPGGRSVLFLAGPFVALLCATASWSPRPVQVVEAMGAVFGATAVAVLGRLVLRRVSEASVAATR
ncbi:UbiA family prenyltransferase [Streptomyces sp. NPDC001822]|uniref:UbiA family prenyltransferase n=1 Tax=Streptomyces sp. NPDC001822 TaxID=3364614 RepID=UPI00369F2732